MLIQMLNAIMAVCVDDGLDSSQLRADIEKLLAYLPYFEVADAELVCQWTESKKTSEKNYTLPYPVYDEKLEQFVKAVYDSELMISRYQDVIHQHGLHMGENLMDTIHIADLTLTRAILTAYIRQERFCDGLWQSAVEEKAFYRILLRLGDFIR